MEKLYDNRSYIPAIDGLRGGAVLAVVLFHLSERVLPGGFAGVDVFFVISGYVVTASLVRSYQPAFGTYVLGFYARRVVRIFPALLACLLVTHIATILFIPEAWLGTAIEQTGRWAFFGLGNIALYLSTDGYFGARTEFNPFTHTWSLGIEEQFYLVFPFVIFLWSRFRESGGRAKGVVKGLMPFLFLCSLVYAGVETRVRQEAAFYLLPSRFWELAAGSLLFQLAEVNTRLLSSDKVRKAYLLFGVVAMSIGFAVGPADSYPFPGAILPVVGSFILIAAVVHQHAGSSAFERVLASTVMTWIGKRSYSIYLWHWPLIVMMRWTVGMESMGQMLFAFLASFVLGHASYTYIELPIRQVSINKRPSDWWIVGSGIAVTILAVWVVHSAYDNRNTLSLSVVTRNRVEWNPEHMKHRVYSKKAKGDRLAGRQLFVWGDSHVWGYIAMVEKLKTEHGCAVYSYSSSGRSLLTLVRPVPGGGPLPPVFHGIYEEIKANAKPGDLLFLPGLRVNRFCDQWVLYDEATSSMHSPEALRLQQEAFAQAVEQLKVLLQLPVTIIIDAPKPILKAPPFRCSDWFNRSNPIGAPGLSISRTELEAHRAPIMSSLAELQQRFPDIVIWDPFPILCPGETLGAFDGEKPLFFDGDHISGHANRVLYPDFERLILEIVGN